jgi:hypothetical protein
MTHDPSDSPAAHLDRYIAGVEERPRRRVKPSRWWHFALPALTMVAIAAAGIWGVGRMIEAW